MIYAVPAAPLWSCCARPWWSRSAYECWLCVVGHVGCCVWGGGGGYPDPVGVSTYHHHVSYIYMIGIHGSVYRHTHTYPYPYPLIDTRWLAAAALLAGSASTPAARRAMHLCGGVAHAAA